MTVDRSPRRMTHRQRQNLQRMLRAADQPRLDGLNDVSINANEGEALERRGWARLTPALRSRRAYRGSITDAGRAALEDPTLTPTPDGR